MPRYRSACEYPYRAPSGSDASHGRRLSFLIGRNGQQAHFMQARRGNGWRGCDDRPTAGVRARN